MLLLKKHLSVVATLLIAMFVAIPALADDAELREEDVPDLRQRALNGDAEAQYELGLAYQRGEVVEHSESEAAHWMKKAAMQENTDAMVNLGIAYRGGFGVEQSYVTAYMWLDLAVARKNPRAIQLRKDIADRMSDEDINRARKEAGLWKPERG